MQKRAQSPSNTKRQWSIYRQIREVLLGLPKLVQVLGVGKFFWLAAEEGFAGFSHHKAKSVWQSSIFDEVLMKIT